MEEHDKYKQMVLDLLAMDEDVLDEYQGNSLEKMFLRMNSFRKFTPKQVQLLEQIHQQVMLKLANVAA